MGDFADSMDRQLAKEGFYNWKLSSDYDDPENPEDREKRIKQQEETARLNKAARTKLNTFHAHMQGWVAEQPHWRLIDCEMLAKAYFSHNDTAELEELRGKGLNIVTEHLIEAIPKTFERFRMTEAARRFPQILEARLYAEGYLLAARDDELVAYSREGSALIYHTSPGWTSAAPVYTTGLEDTVVELLVGCKADALSSTLKAKKHRPWFWREPRLRNAYTSAAGQILFDIDAVSYLATQRTGDNTQDRDSQCLPSFLEALKEIRRSQRRR
ncbi:MAG: hypothetical protein KKD17_00355 [Nanoarchaeota archaeon]|nr:hypothetical protein [Nanoarchaeota archaeon]